ncbi:MAG: hypothetical protein KatS3mg060_3449 [Dehalococcoidia bacterium]|jgi:hypothetical protein|nr:MAG: hypothetical protein KatS3mg060_3449 [Dehalococcoidia bacterium]
MEARRARAAGWAAVALSGALVVFGLTHGAGLPIVSAVSPEGPYNGPRFPYGPASRVVLPVGLKNAPLAGVSTGYAAPVPTATPLPPTPTPVPTLPPRGPYGPPR